MYLGRLGGFLFTMICGKAVDNVQVLPESLLVLLRYKNWPHLRPPLTNARNVIFTEEQVMGTHFTRDWKTLLFGNTNYSNLK